MFLPKPEESCKGCPLFELPYGRRTGFSLPDGQMTAGVVIVAEALGEEEEKEGKALVGPSGHTLFQQLKRIGLERNQFRLLNVLSCRPPDNKLLGMPWYPACVDHCAPILDQNLEAARVQAVAQGQTLVIVALGNVAFERLLGLDKKKDADLLKQDFYGYPFWSNRYKAWVIGAPHPAFLVRGFTHLWPVVHFVFQRAIEIAATGLVLDEPHYDLDPTPEGFVHWVEKCLRTLGDRPLSYDIETPYKKKTKNEEDLAKDESADHSIIRVAFSYRGEDGLVSTTSIKWSAEYMSSIERLFANAAWTLGWNSDNYDLPRVSRFVKVNGGCLDGMVAWHILNARLPMGLGFVTPFYVQNTGMWKHLSEAAPAYYNAKDAHMALLNWEGIRAHLEQAGLWPVYERHWIELSRATRYMSGKGVLLDAEKRDAADAEMSTILTDIRAQMEQAVPRAARKIKIAKKRPKDLTGWEEISKDFPVAYCATCGLQRPKRWKKHTILCGGPSTDLLEPMACYVRPLPFKISKLGLTQYQQALGHKPIKDRKTKKVTFNEDAIAKLLMEYRNDPLYPLILDHRKYEKLHSTYVGVRQPNGRIIGGMPVGPDGRVHTVYGRNANTLRFTSRDPNLQNLPRPKGPEDPATIIRNLIVGAPGHVLYARDYSGIEAVLTGYNAQDPKYIRLAKRDVHTYYTVHAIYELEGPKRLLASDLPDIDWPDEKLFPCLDDLKKRFKKDRNNLYKHLVHACVTGDHEVLTPTGWVRIDQLDRGTPIAQWDQGVITFEPVSHITRYEWDDRLIQWRSRGLSISMTGQHRVPVYNSYGTLKEFRAEDIGGGVMGWGRIPIDGVLEGTEATLDDRWLQLLVAIQADGSLSGHHVRFHLVKERKRERLVELLNGLGLSFSRRPCTDHPEGEHIGFNIEATPILSWLSPHKEFHLGTLLLLSVRQRQVFLDELPYWDGSRASDMSGKQTNYCTTSAHNAQVVQTLTHVSSRQALLRESPQRGARKALYKVSFNARHTCSLSSVVVDTPHYTGAVYCPTVPSGWFLVKHHGRISVTGNSNFMQGAKGAKDKIFSETRIEYPVRTVQKVMDVYYALFPKIQLWHTAVLDEAEKDGYLRNPFGYVCRFDRPYAYEWVAGEWTKKPGVDANKAIAFKPQSTAVGIITEAILRLYYERFEEAGQFLRLQVHDELFFEVPRDYWETLDLIVKEEMERPVPQLRLPASWNMGECLSILTEAKVDLSDPSRWGQMKGF